MSRLLPLLIVIAALFAPGVARADVTIAEGSAKLGYAHLVASATPAASDLRIVEQLDDGTDLGLGSTPTASGIDVQTPWTCRTTRVFAAIAGAERSAPVTVTSPSCADRFRLVAPSSVGLGGNIQVTVVDQWRLGNIGGDICAVRPDGRRICDPFALPDYQFVTSAVFRAARAGEWRVEGDGPAQAVHQRVVVERKHYPSGEPTVLATGDSMMLATTKALEHRLSGIARTVDDVYVASGISRPFVIDWAKLPTKQVRAYRPDGVVISLGIADGRDLPTPDGVIHCCGPDYVAAYAQRVRAIMQTYSRNGRGAVVWLNVPFQRDPTRRSANAAINAAVALASQGLERVKVVDLASRLTPGGVYRRFEIRNGKRVRLRTSDGIHLTPAGGRIASRLAVSALGRLGVKLR